MAVSGNILEIENLAVAYSSKGGDVLALQNFSLALAHGESFGLVGESGCGKSTVAMAIMRYLGRSGRIIGGRIIFDGRDMATLSVIELRMTRGSRIAMVYQDPVTALNPSLTIGFQLMEVPIYHLGVAKKEAREHVLQLLADVKVSDPVLMLDRYPHQISGGQQQRVVIAMALLSNPKLLLLDEPTTGLDVTVEAAVVDLIGELRAKYKISLLYISHNLGLIAKVCARVGVMYAGEMIEEASARALFARPRHPYTRALLQCIPRSDADKRSSALQVIPGQVSQPWERGSGCLFASRCSYADAVCSERAIEVEKTDDVSGHTVRCRRWMEIETLDRPIAAALPLDSTTEASREILAVQNLRKLYALHDGSLRSLWSGASARVVKAIHGISFTAKSGETVAIVGESGCGKSTFAKVLTGLERATDGEIVFDGRDIARISVERRGRAIHRAIQMVFQNPERTFNPSHTIGQAIGRVLKKLLGLRGKAVGKRVGDLLELVRLPRDFAERLPRELSGGQKQRAAIARAFAGDPALVVADEPVAALDVSVQAAIVNLLLEIQRTRATTLLFISHDLAVVRYIADHVVVMYLGEIMESGPTETVFGPPYHPYTEALLAAIPVPDPGRPSSGFRLQGEIPSVIDRPKGCPFASRCPRKLPGRLCDTARPLQQDAGGGHSIACHIPLESLREVAPISVLAHGGRETNTGVNRCQ